MFGETLSTQTSMENYFQQLAEQIESIRARKYSYKKVPMKTEFRTIELWRSVVCECLGTFFYVFVTVACTLEWQDTSHGLGGTTDYLSGKPGVVYTSLLHGIVIATLVQCFGHISGGHLNPVVTLAMMVTCKVTPLRGVLYLLAQAGGAIAGTSLLYAMVPPESRGDMGWAAVHPGVTVPQVVGMELLTSFVFVFTFFATVDPHRPTLGSQPLAIGLAMTLGYLSTYRYADCAVNPARSLGPAFITNKWSKQWVYWAGPVVGGCLAGILYEFVFDPFKRSSCKVHNSIEKIPDKNTESSPTHSGSSGSGSSRSRRFNRGRGMCHSRSQSSNNGHENRAYAYDTAPQCDYEMDRLAAAELERLNSAREFDELTIPDEISIPDSPETCRGYEKPISSPVHAASKY